MIFGISKTTINGILALLIVILTSILSYQVPAALLTPQASRTWLYVTAFCTFALGVLRAVVGFLQTDAPTANQIGQIAITSVRSGAAPAPNAPVPVSTSPLPQTLTTNTHQNPDMK